MTNNKKSALEQLREICASLDKVLENAPPNCEKPELEVTVGALHIACLLELAEKVEALEAKAFPKVCRCNEPDLADDGACRRCLGKPTNEPKGIDLPPIGFNDKNERCWMLMTPRGYEYLPVDDVESWKKLGLTNDGPKCEKCGK